MRFTLEIREHQESGVNGIVIVDGKGDRAYFDPANGTNIAHDILEHPLAPHRCGYTDELMALGGILWLRSENGYPANGTTATSVDDLARDLRDLANYYEDGVFVGSHSGASHLKGDRVMGIIDQAIALTPELYQSAFNGSINWNTDNVRSWIVKGYQLIAKRFNELDSYALAYVLFKSISEECDRWLASAEEGQRAELQISLINYSCELTEVYPSDEY